MGVVMDIEELKRLAEAATGEWKLYKAWDAKPHSLVLNSELGAIEIPHCGYDDPDGRVARAMTANAEFIAAANPQTILALIEKIEDLEAQLTGHYGASPLFPTDE